MRWRDLRLSRAAPHPYGGFTSGWARVGGVRLHVRERTGPDAGPGYVLVHGLAVSHRYLTPTAARLRRPVAIPDLAGFGLSDKPVRVLRVPDHARVLADWLDARGAGPVCLLANSYDCQVAVELAVCRPDLVAALVLVGPTVDPAAASVPGQVGRWLRDLLREDPRQALILGRDVRDAGRRAQCGHHRRRAGRGGGRRVPRPDGAAPGNRLSGYPERRRPVAEPVGRRRDLVAAGRRGVRGIAGGRGGAGRAEYRRRAELSVQPEHGGQRVGAGVAAGQGQLGRGARRQGGGLRR